MYQNELVNKKIKNALQTKKKCAIATIVHVNGSAYRREGSKMYIDEKSSVGMISGGCLEEDVTKITKQVIVTGESLIRRYNLDEDLLWGLGLGCPGEVEIYIERLN